MDGWMDGCLHEIKSDWCRYWSFEKRINYTTDLFHIRSIDTSVCIFTTLQTIPHQSKSHQNKLRWKPMSLEIVSTWMIMAHLKHILGRRVPAACNWSLFALLCRSNKTLAQCVQAICLPCRETDCWTLLMFKCVMTCWASCCYPICVQIVLPQWTHCLRTGLLSTPFGLMWYVKGKKKKKQSAQRE